MIPGGLYYTREHEWLRLEGKNATVGITDHAQHELGDLTYVELPEVGVELHQFEEAGVIESVKAASDLYSPVSGEVVEVNEELADNPALANAEPYDGGWLFRLKVQDAAEIRDLMNADEYRNYVGEEA